MKNLQDENRLFKLNIFASEDVRCHKPQPDVPIQNPLLPTPQQIQLTDMCTVVATMTPTTMAMHMTSQQQPRPNPDV